MNNDHLYVSDMYKFIISSRVWNGNAANERLWCPCQAALVPPFEKGSSITKAVFVTSDRRDLTATSPTEKRCV
jgi:hypothetical protein